jgi:putative ATP-dependent endonuclease of OLD family
LRVAESQLGDLIRRAEFVLFPDEAQRARRLEDLSDGQRSLFHIALTAATLEIERDALALEQDDAPFDQERLHRTYLTLLAIEEPENSLAPFFLSRVMTQAREIAGLASAQVMVSSHSASILSRVEPEEVRYVRLDHPGRHSDVRSLTLPTVDGDAGKYIRLAVRAYPELYFARFVILAEGESEAIVIPRIADAMGLPLDRSFVPIVPLGGRFVSHFWRLLNELGVEHATLLDLDAGRKHGGAKAIRYAVQQLRRVGRDMTDNPLVIDGTIDLDQLDQIEDADLIEEDQRHDWLRALRVEGVFFSSPIDLDFSMLGVFAEEYQFPRRGGQGPRTDAASIAAKKIATLKTGGDPDLYDDGWDDTFTWYPYLFLGQSKPEIHIAALSRFAPAELAANAPSELRAIVKRVRKRLGL